MAAPFGKIALTPSILSDSASLIDMGAYKRSSPFGRFIVDTEATTFNVRTYNDSNTAFNSITQFGVWANGVFFASLDPPGEGFKEFYVGLDKGQRTVEFVAGPQSLPSGTVPLGSYIVSVTANKPMTQLLTTTGLRVGCLVDSIGVGDGTGVLVQSSAWTILLRRMMINAGLGSVTVLGWGYRSLFDTCSTGGKITATLDEIESLGLDVLTMHLMTNDYGLARWSASSYGAGLSAFLAAAALRLPALRIIVFSATNRTSEAANVFGDTLGAYRATGAAAASGAGVQYEDCDLLIDPATQTIDGVHINQTGTPVMANFVFAAAA